MSDERVRVGLVLHERRLCVEIAVLDAALLGLSATLYVRLHVLVHDRTPVNESRVLFEIPLLLVAQQRVPLGGEINEVFSYTGKNISTAIRTELEIPGAGLFGLFKARDRESHELQIGAKPELYTNAPELVDPKDAFSLATTWRALSPEVKSRALLLSALTVAIAGLVFLGLAYLAQSEPDAIWFGIAPVLIAIFVVQGIVKRRLRTYMSFELGQLPQHWRRGQSLSVARLVDGVSRTRLIGAQLRIVAANRECGQYKRRHGHDNTKTETVSFVNSTRAVLLYVKNLPAIEAGTPLSTLIGRDVVSFDPAFDALYPPCMTSSTHGLSLHWEIQLLVPDFVDQELVAPSNIFVLSDFLSAGRH